MNGGNTRGNAAHSPAADLNARIRELLAAVVEMGKQLRKHRGIGLTPRVETAVVAVTEALTDAEEVKPK